MAAIQYVSRKNPEAGSCKTDASSQPPAQLINNCSLSSHSQTVQGTQELRAHYATGERPHVTYIEYATLTPSSVRR